MEEKRYRKKEREEMNDNFPPRQNGRRDRTEKRGSIFIGYMD